MHTMCRLCFSFGADDLTVLHDNIDVIAKIRSFSALEILLKENLPNKICKKCKSEVDHCYAFNQMIQKNEQQLLNLFENDNRALEEFINGLKSESKPDNGNVKLEIEDSDTIDIPNSKPKYSTNTGCNKTKFNKEENTLNYISEDEDDISLSEMKTNVNEKESVYPNLKTNATNYESIQGTIHSNEELTWFGSGQETNEWKCLTCENVFTSRAILLKHYRTTHGGTDESRTINNFTQILTANGYNYQCCICEKVYDAKKNMKRHMITHVEERPYDCSICGRKYKTAVDILRHARAHSGFKTLACSQGCGFRTVYRSALQNHENRHKTKFKFTCEECGKGFQVRTWFEQHRNVHTGERPYGCDRCDKAFHMEKYLAVHRSKLHPASMTAERHYCIHCVFRCASRHALTQHLKEQHDMAASFLCDFCGKSLATAEYLKFHRRTHLGEKPYSCSTCSKAFVKKCNLTLHERIHTGERPHVCSKCGKAFAQKGALILHNRYHTGSRPFQCTKCQKAFFTNSQLTSHQKSCNRDATADRHDDRVQCREGSRDPITKPAPSVCLSKPFTDRPSLGETD